MTLFSIGPSTRSYQIYPGPLQRRARLRPVLDLARDQGCTFRSSSFTLHTPADLPGLFAFLDVAPIQIPNWLSFIPHMWGVDRAPRARKGIRVAPKHANNSPDVDPKVPLWIRTGTHEQFLPVFSMSEVGDNGDIGRCS